MIAAHITTIDLIFNQLVRLQDCDVHALNLDDVFGHTQL